MLTTKDTKRILTHVSLSPAVIRAAKGHSKRYECCPRSEVGSLSHYVWVAVLNQLRDDGLNVEAAGWYRIPRRVNRLDTTVSPNV